MRSISASLLALAFAFTVVKCEITAEYIANAMREGRIVVDCSLLQLDKAVSGPQISSDDLGGMESLYVGDASGGVPLEAVYRLPLYAKLTQVEEIIQETCVELLKIASKTQLTFLTNWSRWGQCNPGTCQETRMRLCVWDGTGVSCPDVGDQEVRVCQDTARCLDSCVVLKKPVLTRKSDIKLSWTQNSNCDITRASANIVLGGVSRVIHAPEGTRKLVIPYNSRDKTFKIETDFRGTYDGIITDLKKNIILKNFKTFDFACTKRQTTDAIDFACKYNAKVLITVAVDGFNYGDYLEEGTVRFSEKYCNENRTIIFEATSRSGERVVEKFDLPAKTEFNCKSVDEEDPISISNQAEIEGDKGVSGTEENEESVKDENEIEDDEEEEEYDEEEDEEEVSSEDKPIIGEYRGEETNTEANDPSDKPVLGADDNEDTIVVNTGDTTNVDPDPDDFAKDKITDNADLTDIPSTSPPPMNNSVVEEQAIVDKEGESTASCVAVSTCLCIQLVLYFL